MDKELSTMTSRQIRQLLEQKKIPFDENLFEKKILLEKYSEKIKQIIKKEEEDKKNSRKKRKISKKKNPTNNDSLKHTQKYKMRIHYTVKHGIKFKKHLDTDSYLNKKHLSDSTEIQDLHKIKKKAYRLSIVSETIDTDQNDLHKKNICHEENILRIEKPLEKQLYEDSYNRIIIDKSILTNHSTKPDQQVINAKNACIKIVYDSRNEEENKKIESELEQSNCQNEIKKSDSIEKISVEKEGKNEENNVLLNKSEKKMIKFIKLNIKKDKENIVRKISHEDYNFQEYSPSNKTNDKLSIDIMTTPSSSIITPTQKHGQFVSDFNSITNTEKLDKEFSKKPNFLKVVFNRKHFDKFQVPIKLEKQLSNISIDQNKQINEEKEEENHESHNSTLCIQDIERALDTDSQALSKKQILIYNHSILSLYIFIVTSTVVIMYVFFFYYYCKGNLQSIKLYMPLIICSFIYGGCIFYMNSRSFKYLMVQQKLLQAIKKNKLSFSRDEIIQIFTENLKMSKENFLLSPYSLQIIDTLSNDTEIKLTQEDSEKVYFRPRFEIN